MNRLRKCSTVPSQVLKAIVSDGLAYQVARGHVMLYGDGVLMSARSLNRGGWQHSTMLSLDTSPGVPSTVRLSAHSFPLLTESL